MTKKKDSKPSEAAPMPHEEGPVARAEQQTPKEDYYDALLRSAAEFENYRKRTEREKPLLIQFGRAEVIKKLLPIYDAMTKAEAEVNKKETDAQHIKQGLNLIFEEFKKFFKSEGVEITDCCGAQYDPMKQEAITTCPCEPCDDGKVIQEITKGVSLNGEVLRPAQVIVGKKQED